MKKALLIVFILLLTIPLFAAKRPPYSYFRVGSANDITTTPPAGPS